MMKKNLKLFASALGFIFLFYACRTDEVTNSEQRKQNEKIAAFERFENLRSQDILNKKTHSSKSGDALPLSYAQPFSEIIYQFLVKHPDFYDKLANDFGEIDYNVASQTFGEDKKYIFYPILKDGKVTSLWYGKLKEDRSWVDFYLVHDTSASTQRMIGEFQNYYSKKAVSRGEPDPPVKEIPEIVITPPGTNPPINDPLPNTGGGGTYTPPYTGDMSGGPIMHGGGTGTSTTQDPCKKTKSILTNPNVQTKISELKTQSTLGGEKGVKFKVDGTPSETISGGEHSVNFGDKTGYAGGYHNHTPTGISMLSPPDIDQLLGFARAQPISNPENVKNAYVGMVAPNGMHYVIRFNGTYQDAITNFSQEQLDEYTDRYQTRYGIYKPSSGDMNNEAIEKFFFKALKDMGLEGKVNLQRIENDGTVKMIIKNTDGTITATPCP
ncbi:hypothetical protein [Chryseobacterium sp.]|uniref:hypothetical protein n=1 Tax=Chryseobacterium sp. TaxID=1871047 RepID=UPI0035AEF474